MGNKYRREAPYWVLIVVLTPLTPLARYLMKRQLWPFNERGPLDRSDPREGSTVMDEVGEPHPFDAEFCGPGCEPIEVLDSIGDIDGQGSD